MDVGPSHARPLHPTRLGRPTGHGRGDPPTGWALRDDTSVRKGSVKPQQPGVPDAQSHAPHGGRSEDRAQPVPDVTVACPSGVVRALEMRKPSPLASVHLTPEGDERQVNGPREIDMPYCKVGVPSPALERHCTPVHSVSVLSCFNVTDLGGEMVRHSAEVSELGATT